MGYRFGRHETIRMSKAHEKQLPPAYGSFKTLVSFANDVREGGHVPLQVDRTLMPKLSGSAVGETLASLRFLGLITPGEKSTPTPKFEEYVMAGDADRQAVLASIVREAYSFLFKAPDFDIERASGQQVADLFRTAGGISGSTLVRAVSFFLAAAKDSGIKVSHNIKPPKQAGGSGNGSRGKRERKAEIGGTHVAPNRELPPDADTHKFELPIPGKPSVVVYIPTTLDAKDWDMFAQMFTIYVARWKGFSQDVKVVKKDAE